MSPLVAILTLITASASPLPAASLMQGATAAMSSDLESTTVAAEPIPPGAYGSREQQAATNMSPGQEAVEGGSHGTAALRVFLDCQRCDFDYLRREVTFVDYVRDRQDADVHVLVRTRRTGGGTEWTFEFIGRERLAGRQFVLEYNTSSTDTEDEEREGYAQLLRVGLLNFLVGTETMRRVDIEYTAADELQLMAQPEDDPWNFWVFRAELDVSLDGEQRQTSRELEGAFSANRTTEQWKLRSEIEGRFSEDEFELSDGRTFTDTRTNFDAFGQLVRSLGEHWGASTRARISSSTFANEDLEISFAPGVEYNFFPYSESSRRSFTFTYEIGTSFVDYEEETIFLRLSETLFDETLDVSFDAQQPWGESHLSVELGHFLHDVRQYRVEFRGELDFRITRGLSLDFEGDLSLIRDQRSLPREELTDEEVLLERRELATDYRYELSVGISYTFGSIFNNVVNPRFGGRR